MWAHVAFILVAAANLASHVVIIITTADYLPITLQLVTTEVPYQGRAILLDKASRTFVISCTAISQVPAFVAFQSALFTVIFSASAYITLQSCHWSRRRETRQHIKNTLTLHIHYYINSLFLIYSCSDVRVGLGPSQVHFGDFIRFVAVSHFEFARNDANYTVDKKENK